MSLRTATQAVWKPQWRTMPLLHIKGQEPKCEESVLNPIDWIHTAIMDKAYYYAGNK